VNTFAGGITWVDAQYDERLGPALERLMDRPGELNWGEALQERIERMISEAFFLNVINLPEAQGGDKMTAYETQERVKEYIRRALPLFEPMEVEYNGGLCEQTWNVAMDLGMFGSFEDMPDQLKGHEINWQFQSPLQEANDRLKAEAFNQAGQLLAQAATLDPGVRFDLDIDTAFREALNGIVPANWIVPVEVANSKKEQEAQIQRATQAAQAMAGAADVATKVGGAVEQLGTAAQSVHAAQGMQQGAAA
jgi:hypothetical protein